MQYDSYKTPIPEILFPAVINFKVRKHSYYKLGFILWLYILSCVSLFYCMYFILNLIINYIIYLIK